MSDRDSAPERHDCGGDVAAYALRALEPAEVEAFQRHLETCAVCKEELESFQGVVNELPLSVPQHKAPTAIRRRVMREVGGDARRAGRPAPQGRRSGWLVPRPLVAAGVALLVAIGVVVGLQTASAPSGTRVLNAQVAGPGSAQLRIARGHASLVLRHFAPPPRGKIYQVWVQRGKRAPSPTSALFGVTSSGRGDVDVPGSLHGVSTVMVTPEPAGGSRKPTHPPVVIVSLT